MRSRALVLGAGLALAAGAASVHAGAPDVIAQAIEAARASWKKKDTGATARALEEALVLARDAAPLDIRQAVVVHEPHTGLGLYTPAPDAAVRGRELKLYVEVAGYGVTRAEGGANAQLDVEADFAFEDEGALVPLGTQKLGSQRFFSRTHTGLTSFGVDVRLGDKSPAGRYRMTLRVNDAIGGKRAAKELVFVLR